MHASNQNSRNIDFQEKMNQDATPTSTFCNDKDLTLNNKYNYKEFNKFNLQPITSNIVVTQSQKNNERTKKSSKILIIKNNLNIKTDQNEIQNKQLLKQTKFNTQKNSIQQNNNKLILSPNIFEQKGKNQNKKVEQFSFEAQQNKENERQNKRNFEILRRRKILNQQVNEALKESVKNKANENQESNFVSFSVQSECSYNKNQQKIDDLTPAYMTYLEKKQKKPFLNRYDQISRNEKKTEQQNKEISQTKQYQINNISKLIQDSKIPLQNLEKQLFSPISQNIYKGRNQNPKMQSQHIYYTHYQRPITQPHQFRNNKVQAQTLETEADQVVPEIAPVPIINRKDYIQKIIQKNKNSKCTGFSQTPVFNINMMTMNNNNINFYKSHNQEESSRSIIYEQLQSVQQNQNNYKDLTGKQVSNQFCLNEPIISKYEREQLAKLISEISDQQSLYQILGNQDLIQGPEISPQKKKSSRFQPRDYIKKGSIKINGENLIPSPKKSVQDENIIYINQKFSQQNKQKHDSNSSQSQDNSRTNIILLENRFDLDQIEQKRQVMKLDTQNIMGTSKEFHQNQEDSHPSNMLDNTPFNTRFKITEIDQDDEIIIKQSITLPQSDQYQISDEKFLRKPRYQEFENGKIQSIDNSPTGELKIEEKNFINVQNQNSALGDFKENGIEFNQERARILSAMCLNSKENSKDEYFSNFQNYLNKYNNYLSQVQTSSPINIENQNKQDILQNEESALSNKDRFKSDDGKLSKIEMKNDAKLNSLLNIYQNRQLLSPRMYTLLQSDPQNSVYFRIIKDIYQNNHLLKNQFKFKKTLLKSFKEQEYLNIKSQLNQNKHDLKIKIDGKESFLNQFISTKRKTNELIENDLKNTNIQNNIKLIESQNPKIIGEEQIIEESATFTKQNYSIDDQLQAQLQKQSQKFNFLMRNITEATEKQNSISYSQGENQNTQISIDNILQAQFNFLQSQEGQIKPQDISISIKSPLNIQKSVNGAPLKIQGRNVISLQNDKAKALNQMKKDNMISQLKMPLNQSDWPKAIMISQTVSTGRTIEPKLKIKFGGDSFPFGSNALIQQNENKLKQEKTKRSNFNNKYNSIKIDGNQISASDDESVVGKSVIFDKISKHKNRLNESQKIKNLDLELTLDQIISSKVPKADSTKKKESLSQEKIENLITKKMEFEMKKKEDTVNQKQIDAEELLKMAYINQIIDNQLLLFKIQSQNKELPQQNQQYLSNQINQNLGFQEVFSQKNENFPQNQLQKIKLGYKLIPNERQKMKSQQQQRFKFLGYKGTSSIQNQASKDKHQIQIQRNTFGFLNQNYYQVYNIDQQEFGINVQGYNKAQDQRVSILAKINNRDSQMSRKIQQPITHQPSQIIQDNVQKL